MEESKTAASQVDVTEPVAISTTMNHERITLIPQPSSDARDPLNWPRREKYISVLVLSLSAFAGFTSSLAGQLEVAPEASTFGVPQTYISYQNSSSQAGIIVGCLGFYIASRVVGRMSAMFWALVLNTAAEIWSSLMTHKYQFNIFLASRGIAGLGANVVGTLAPRCLIDMFFLHQRGRAFNVFHFFFDMGSTTGPSICAFIGTGAGNWAWAFRWTAILNGVCCILVLLFLHDTTWDRSPGAVNRARPKTFVANRIATYFPGTGVMGTISFKEFLRRSSLPFKITLTPVTLVLGTFVVFSVGWNVAMNSITPVWLQKPVAAGGYGFTPLQNAFFQFSHWVGIGLVLLYGQLASDRIPLALAARYGRGKWKPEYRLHALWFPVFVCGPLGLGIFGYGLARHLHWAVLAVAHTMVTFAAMCINPMSVNYLSECFINAVEETAIIMNICRVAFGLSVAFYIDPWVAKMGFAWTYGLMAFIWLFSWLFVLLLMWKGHAIRQWDPFGLIATEEGKHVIDTNDSTESLS